MTGPLVIAEAGVNHNGDLARARDMVAAAAEAGADYVKFQAFSTASLVADGARTAAYQAANTGETDQTALLKKLEIGLDEFAVLAEECRAQSIRFLCTPFEISMTRALVSIGMDRIKVASGELTNTIALATFAEFGLPVILSTGMATLDEVGAALAVLEENGADDITLLHCTSLYPAPPETLNLRAISTMAERFSRPVGYSDHSLGDHAAVAAVALGARVIEKHFTLDRGLPGPDHRASLEPGELASMIKKLRATAVSLGDGRKEPTDAERDTAKLVRRSWHAARDLPAGTVLDKADLVLVRPADGLSPADSPLGHRLEHAVSAGTPVRAEDVADIPA